MTLETWSCKEFCFYGQNIFSPTKIHCQLTQVYRDGVMRVQHARKWCKLENGRTHMITIALDTPLHHGRKWTQHDWRNWFRKTDKLQFKIDLLHFSCPSELQYCKVCTSWVPRCLIEDHKQHSFTSSAVKRRWKWVLKSTVSGKYDMGAPHDSPNRTTMETPNTFDIKNIQSVSVCWKRYRSCILGCKRRHTC